MIQSLIWNSRNLGRWAGYKTYIFSLLHMMVIWCPLTFYGKDSILLFIKVMHNLRKEKKDSVIPDYLIQVYMLDWEEFQDFQEAMSNTVKATLNVIVACQVSIPPEERNTIFRSCKEMISILRKLEDLIKDYHFWWMCLYLEEINCSLVLRKLSNQLYILLKGNYRWLLLFMTT